MNLTVRKLKLAILEALASGGKLNKFNLIGRGLNPGNLERGLGITMGSEEREPMIRVYRRFIMPASVADLAHPFLRLPEPG